MSEPLLVLDKLCKSFGSVVVADQIDLAVARGEALGIVGPNGAGKSSLFNLIGGSLAADRGRILLNGGDVTALKPSARCRAGIGRSFQIPRPFAGMTVFENLLVAAIHGGGCSEAGAVRRCGAILDRTGLSRRADDRAGRLTLLERKRLELARALATEPKLLLLDEIAGGLTEAECRSLIETIGDIRAAGVTLIWIEHVVHALLAVVGRLIVLDYGRKIAEGEPRAVINSPLVRQVYTGIAE
jgi:branched-chain amino acid transport system ATP-binding protein